MNVLELSATQVELRDLHALRDFARGLEESQLRDLLLGLTTHVEHGEDVALLDSQAELSPAQVAQRLKMSRTHLYKLLDNGTLPSHRVGRDRRVKFSDLIVFERRRQQDRHELAQRFAHADATRAGALSELLNESE